MDKIDWKEITSNGLWPAYRLSGGVEGEDRTKPNKSEVTFCRRWLRANASPTKTIRRNHSSYGLKHIAEKAFVGRWYVSNGAFIEAARLEGYRIVREEGSPNAYFNMCLKPDATRHVD